MKKIGSLYLLIILFTFANYSLEAQKIGIKSSTISFFSDGLLEDIAAVNTASQAILNLVDGAFVLRIPITSFEFPNQLMQEHFNENYLESEKFPTATFKGKLDRTFEMGNIANTTFEAQGELMIHGITQERTLVIDISDEKKGIKVKGKFDVALEDHDVEIPSLLFQKIAEIVAVDIEIHLTELKL
jgi:polyisoprenoid-binding protein YceI